ncbi:MAG: hypothetical protein K9W45_01565 [Candidatus Heimdallarchaeum aukensis]|uniref:Uncharacterized protein n=1 Tax=Candidatus Heimdallarchaeum aukensis TaxID=2876573 RepID=A0A9Y1BMU7_9ARCH|nr:MAG: hypothetical protein K9W45_01565 [Candidatus Heimdallarchaeum aukensis]
MTSDSSCYCIVRITWPKWIVATGQIALGIGILLLIIFSIFYTKTSWENFSLYGIYVGAGFLLLGALISYSY